MIILKGRQMLITNLERYIGTTYDNNTEIRTFSLDRVTVNNVDLAALSFRLDLEYENGSKDTIILEKEIQEETVLLTWTISKNVLQVPGTVFINIRGTDSQGTVKWASLKAAMYVEDTINTPGTYTGSLSELEQLEQRIDRKTETLDANESQRQENETLRQQNEETRKQNELDRQRAETDRDKKTNQVIQTFGDAIQEAKNAAKLSESWAIGGTQSRQGEDENNSKYYSSQSKTEADRAARAAEQAETYASIIPPKFHIDTDTMELIQDSQADGIIFSLDENKILSYEYLVGGEKV